MSEAGHERGPGAASVQPPLSLLQSVRDVAVAIIAAPFRRLSTRAKEYLITGCALWALVCPLLLWISWSKAGFLILIGSVALAIAIIYLLILLHPDERF